MIKHWKGIVQYTVLISITVVLLWLSLDAIQVTEGQTRWGFIVNVWKSANKPFLLLSGVITILSHYFRSARWQLMMNQLGHPLKGTHGFYSVMIGYFVNLAVPRGGEISRCYNLYKLNGTPVDQSFGTVVAERLVDVLFLLSLIGIAFFVQFDRLIYFFQQLDISLSGYSSKLKLLWILPVLAVLTFSIAIIFKIVFKEKYQILVQKISTAWEGMKKGLLIIFKLKHRALFIAYSIGIWLMYYLMSYFIILAFPETQHLGMLESLTIFVIGGIAMAVPLPGGTGSYHVLVPLGLVLLYGIARDEAIAFSFIFHGWQTLMIILFGLFSLFASQWYIRVRNHGDKSKNSI